MTFLNWPKNIDDLPLYLSKQAWAQLRRVSEKTLEREMDAGRGAPFVRIGKRTLFPRDEALAWLKQQHVSSIAEARRRERDRQGAAA